MYFDQSNNFPHGIMFHQFHDNRFYKSSEGSISKDDFYKLINFIGKKNILDAKIFLKKKIEGKLKKTNVCFTFDDGLKCQIKVALPVLEDMGIKSFFFVNTSILNHNPDFIEIVRFFKINYFDNTNQFYDLFFKILNKDLKVFYKKNKKIIDEKIKLYPFYSRKDIEFRLIRDRFLSDDEYKTVLIKMFEKKNFFPDQIISKLFLNKADLVNLDSLGHTIGLHSHNHVKDFERLSSESQKLEYEKNQETLSMILNKSPNTINSMSHPLGSYNQTSLKILKKLNVKIGFRDNMFVSKKMNKINNSNLELAREDHALVMKKLKNENNDFYIQQQ